MEIINKEQLADTSDGSLALVLEKKPVAIVCNSEMKELIKQVIPATERKLEGAIGLNMVSNNLPGAQVVTILEYPDVLAFCQTWSEAIKQFGHLMEPDQLDYCERMEKENFNGWGF